MRVGMKGSSCRFRRLVHVGTKNEIKCNTAVLRIKRSLVKCEEMNSRNSQGGSRTYFFTKRSSNIRGCT